MTTYRSEDGSVFRVGETAEILTPTIFGYYIWKQYDGEVPELIEEINLKEHGWCQDHNGVWFKAATSTEIEAPLFSTETGGFTRASGTFADEVHRDAAWFDNFKPRTDGERRFKEMVQSIEQRARFEEENKM